MNYYHLSPPKGFFAHPPACPLCGFPLSLLYSVVICTLPTDTFFEVIILGIVGLEGVKYKKFQSLCLFY